MTGCCSTSTPQSIQIQRGPAAAHAGAQPSAQPSAQGVDGAVDTSVGEADSSYTVIGMTCGHCVSSVTRTVDAIEGITDVRVDLASGSLTFTSDAPVARDAGDAAVREGGDQLA